MSFGKNFIINIWYVSTLSKLTQMLKAKPSLETRINSLKSSYEPNKYGT